jgi:hypothetical protein
MTLGGGNSAPEVALSPDGFRLLAGDGYGLIKIYALEINDLISLAQDRVTRGFTTEECQRYLHLETCPIDY